MRSKVLLCLIFLSFTSPLFADLPREKIIEREMACIADHRAQGDVVWGDVCSLPESSTNERAINKALDQMEEELKEDNPSGPTQDIRDTSASIFSRATGGDFMVEDIFRKQFLPQRKTHSLDLGEETFYYFYEEPGPHVKLTGTMIGYYGTYTYRPADESIFNNMILNSYSLEGRYAKGDLDYQGSGRIDNKPNTAYETRFLLGKDYLLADESLWNFYFGAGYRHLVDRGDGMLSTTNAYAYDRHSNYFYLPLGFKATLPHGPWHTEINLEYDILARGYQISDLSNGDQFNHLNNPDIRNRQTKGFGVRSSIKFGYKSKWLDVFGEPFIRYWNIDDSKLTFGVVDGSPGLFYEPHNRTFEIGSKFGLQF